METPELPSPLGHHAWPRIPSSISGDRGHSIPHALRLPPHAEDPGKRRVPKTSSQRRMGSTTHLQHITPLAVTATARLPPSWWPCHLEVISPAVAAAGLAAAAPWAGSLSPDRAPGAAPNCGDTHSLAQPRRRRRAGTHIPTRTNAPQLPPETGLPAAACPLPRRCCHPLPGDRPQPLVRLRHPTSPPQGPIPVGVLPPSVPAYDAARSANSGKQEVSEVWHGGPVTPVAGVAGEVGVPASPLLLSPCSRSLAPWPDPARQHRASPALSPCPQQQPFGEERRSQAGGDPPTPTEPGATPIPSLSLFPPLNPLRRSSRGGLSLPCASRLPGAGRGQAGIADPIADPHLSPKRSHQGRDTARCFFRRQAGKATPPGTHSTLPTLSSVPTGSAREGKMAAGLASPSLDVTKPWRHGPWGRCHGGDAATLPRCKAGSGSLAPTLLSPGPRWRCCRCPSAVPAPVSPQGRRCVRGHSVRAQPWGWQGCGDTSRRIPLRRSGRERSGCAPRFRTPPVCPPRTLQTPWGFRGGNISPALPRQLKDPLWSCPPTALGHRRALPPPVLPGKGVHQHAP